MFSASGLKAAERAAGAAAAAARARARGTRARRRTDAALALLFTKKRNCTDSRRRSSS